MAILLVDTYGSLFDSVYTNSLEPFVVHVTDSEDEHDPEHLAHYAACDYLARYGGLHRYDDGAPAEIIRTFIFRDPLERNSKALSLIAKEHKLSDDAGGAEQQLDAAFAAGYLECLSELSRSLQLKEDVGENIDVLRGILQPITTQQYERFLKFAESINDPERYSLREDEVAK